MAFGKPIELMTKAPNKDKSPPPLRDHVLLTGLSLEQKLSLIVHDLILRYHDKSSILWVNVHFGGFLNRSRFTFFSQLYGPWSGF